MKEVTTPEAGYTRATRMQPCNGADDRDCRARGFTVTAGAEARHAEDRAGGNPGSAPTAAPSPETDER